MTRFFTYPPHFVWAALLLGLMLAAYAAFAWRRVGRYGQHRWVSLAFGLVYLAYVPQFWVHEVRLDVQVLRWTDGLWWQPQNRELQFAEVSKVCITRRASGRNLNTMWRVTYKDAARPTQEVLLSEVLRWNAAEIQAALQRQGVEFGPCA